MAPSLDVATLPQKQIQNPASRQHVDLPRNNSSVTFFKTCCQSHPPSAPDEWASPDVWDGDDDDTREFALEGAFDFELKSQ